MCCGTASLVVVSGHNQKGFLESDDRMMKYNTGAKSRLKNGGFLDGF
jgi:hypothetical protein